LKRFRFRPTYSNVVATLALFFALAGGAWAATQLPKESVGSKQLKNGAVTPAKLSGAAKSGMTGARGEAGPQGALGPRGNEGSRGEAGSDGATGPQGIRGATGATGATGAHGETGDQGPRGERGPEGPTGPQGDQGVPGPRGYTGEEGEKGERGEQGPPGDTGAQGVQGPTGPSDAYFDISEDQPMILGNEALKTPLELTLPVGKYVLQAVLTVEGDFEAVVAKCLFKGESDASLGPANAFFADVTEKGSASLVGTTTAVVSEQPTKVFVMCEGPAGTGSYSIPPEGGHLTAMKVGELHG